MRSTNSLQRRTALTLALSAMLGCDRTPEAKPTPPPPPVAVPHAVGAVSPDAPTTKAADFKFPSFGRLVAIGDIHGDLKALRAALKLAGAIDGDDRWIGKDLTVVQTGDQVDRGDQDREVLDVLEKLERDAKAGGGSLVVLNGNHELMNTHFDFRYVTRRSFVSFDDFAERAPAQVMRLPQEERGRAAAFVPGGPYAKKLAQRPTVALVGDSLFAHGGVLPAHVDYGLARINAEASAYLLGQRPALPAILTAEDAPVWMREYGSPDVPEEVCQALGRALAQVGAKRLVVGHTVQKDGIAPACQNRLFRIDVGLSAYYGNNPVQVLEVTAKGARILTAGPSAIDSKGAARDSALHSAP